MTDGKDLVELLTDCGAVEYGEFTLTSGRKSDYYINMKRAMTDPGTLKEIAGQMTRMVGEADKLAGMELGAIPILVAMALETDLPYVMVRKERKGHGTALGIEGEVIRGERVVVVEDVSTTGGSLLETVERLVEAGGEVKRVLVIVDRQEGAADLFSERGVEFIPLLTRDDLMRDRSEKTTVQKD